MGMEGWIPQLRTFTEAEGHDGPRDIPLAEIVADAKHAGEVLQDTARAGVLGAGIVLTATQPLVAQERLAPQAHEQVVRSTGQLALDSLVLDATHADSAHSNDVITGAELACLEKNIYNEARGEIDEGQLAVAFVTIARAQSKKFPSSICGVVYQNKQFSWTFDKKILEPRPIDGARARHISGLLGSLVAGQKLADAATLLGMMLGLPHDTLYYKRTDWDETKMSPKTAALFARLKKVATIGHHDFFTEAQ
jgi:hypothetical protein